MVAGGSGDGWRWVVGSGCWWFVVVVVVVVAGGSW
jgi:hypothetical protein